jgi:hypothetical protein
MSSQLDTPVVLSLKRPLYTHTMGDLVGSRAGPDVPEERKLSYLFREFLELPA